MEWIVARWITFAGTLLAIGACVVGLAIVPRTHLGGDARRRLTRDVARIGTWACLALIPAALMRLADQAMALQAPGDPWLGGLGPLLSSTTWGTGFLWQSAATVLTLSGFLGASRMPHDARWWLLIVPATAALCATPSMQGHAIGSESYTALAVASDVMHVAGGGMWLGGVAVIGWLGFAMPDADGAVAAERATDSDGRLRMLVPLVPPVALCGAALLLVSGVVSSVLHLRAVAELWRETWGRYVLLKVVLVVAILALGAINWRRVGPRMAITGDVQALRRSLVTEVLGALLVLLVTALLVVTPLPGE